MWESFVRLTSSVVPLLLRRFCKVLISLCIDGALETCWADFYLKLQPWLFHGSFLGEKAVGCESSRTRGINVTRVSAVIFCGCVFYTFRSSQRFWAFTLCSLCWCWARTLGRVFHFLTDKLFVCRVCGYVVFPLQVYFPSQPCCDRR